jgi:DNA-binding transcriptional LysR family regulator
MRRHHSLGLDDIRAVVILAEELNFHRAARRAGLSQSGLTRVLIRVENYVGTLLFERNHSKRQSVVLTDAGRSFVEHVRMIVVLSESAAVAARETAIGIEHMILAGKSPFVDLRLIAVLRSMELPLFPKLRVDVQTTSADELLACVRTGELSLAVVTNPLEDAILSCTPLRCTQFTVALPEDHKCANKNAVTLKDLVTTPWILIDRRVHSAHYDTFRRRAKDLGVGPERIYHIADAQEAFDMVRRTGGAAFLAPHGAAQTTEDGVVFCTLGEMDILLTANLVVRAENTSKLLSEFVRTFVKRLKQTELYQPKLPESSAGADCSV